MNGFGENQIQKIEKTEKKCQMLHKIKTITSDKAFFFANTVSSLYFEIRAKKFTQQDHLLFRFNYLFGMTEITTLI